MKKILYLTICVGLIIPMSGCAGTGQSMFSCGPFKNQPVRNTIRGWFRGDACSTCNPPAGQPANFGTQVAPLCENCNSGITGQPVYPGTVDSGVPYYDDPGLNMNAPVNTQFNPIQNQPTSPFQGDPFGN